MGCRWAVDGLSAATEDVDAAVAWAGCAFGCRLLGIPVTVVMPTTAPITKVCSLPQCLVSMCDESLEYRKHSCVCDVVVRYGRRG